MVECVDGCRQVLGDGPALAGLGVRRGGQAGSDEPDLSGERGPLVALVGVMVGEVGIRSAMRWSPIRGCGDPHTAMVRAKALTAGTASGTTDSTFWQASAEQAVRCLLHAAALGECSSSDLYRWSLSAVQAREAVMILGSHPDAAQAWHQALDAIISADPRQRDSVWAMVTIAFSALADPKVLDAVSPAPGEGFDPERFMEGAGAGRPTLGDLERVYRETYGLRLTLTPKLERAEALVVEASGVGGGVAHRPRDRTRIPWASAPTRSTRPPAATPRYPPRGFVVHDPPSFPRRQSVPWPTSSFSRCRMSGRSSRPSARS